MTDQVQGFLRPKGDIVTLLDLSPRDAQDSEYTPLGSDKTWWLPDSQRRVRPFSLTVQQFPFRGPTAFGQRFTFDIGSVSCGDLLAGAMLQIDLGHWLDDATLLRLESGAYTYSPGQTPWAYANSLGTAIIQSAEFEVNEQTLEKIDGDFIFVSSILLPDVNQQFGLATDGLGLRPLTYVPPQSQPFPTPSGTLLVPLNFFFQRVRLAEAFPLLSCADGSVRIHITLRPFAECVRRLGAANATQPSPLNTQFMFTQVGPIQSLIPVQTSIAIPQFKGIKLITYGAHTDGPVRSSHLTQPFELMTRTVKTFFFDEPLKYTVNKTTDHVQIQLPLEANGPMEEILWFVRRKDSTSACEWTNFGAVLAGDLDSTFNPPAPLLQRAKLQCNGIDIVNQDERWFRQHIALAHKGGVAPYKKYMYGYSFSAHPGAHQPSGTVNASRLQDIRLTLDVTAAAGAWEVKVFVLGLDWFRFQGGLVNRMFQD